MILYQADKAADDKV